MKTFKNKITFNLNARGCPVVDSIKGCKHNCYGECYAKRSIERYGFDFNNPVNRNFTADKFNQLKLFDFYDSEHEQSIINEVNSSNLPFVRIGDMGDPSEDWEHTFKIIKVLLKSIKKVVVVTKHWKPIPVKLRTKLKHITLNTSVSAMDTPDELRYRLKQYEELKRYCNSVLRVVTCDFNKYNTEGSILYDLQNDLLQKEKVIDTVFRPSLNNKLVTDGVIKIEKVMFLNKVTYASMYNKTNYFGYCDKCPDMCGIFK
jgi:hypothetical protein